MLYECRCQPQEARDRLAAFGFRGEDVLTPVSALSGGERSRLKLCMVMGSDINVLILDEPTNHLDIASREWMEDALSDYEEALLFVSHDRYFIEKFATRIWSAENGGIIDYRGGFEEFKAYRARQQVYTQIEKTEQKKKEPHRKGAPNAEKQLAKLERDIEKAEAAMMELNKRVEEYSSDYQKLMELDEEKAKLSATLDGLYADWEELSE
jgi:ABC-type multidrug transport system ATPase subunit